MDSCNISLVQMAPTLGDMKRNTTRIVEIIDAIRPYPQTHMVIFPELAITGYECPDLFPELARRPEDSEEIGLIRETARQKRFYILVGYAERGEGVKLYNSLLLIGNDGSIVGN